MKQGMMKKYSALVIRKGYKEQENLSCQESKLVLRVARFTLVEIIAVLLLVGLIAGVGVSLLAPMVNHYLQMEEIARSTQQVQVALTRMVKELSSLLNGMVIISYSIIQVRVN